MLRRRSAWPSRPIAETTVSPDGTRVVTAGSDEGVSIWDVTSGQLLSVPGEQPGTVHAVVFSADGAALLAMGSDRKLRVWNVSTGLAITPPLEHRDSVVGAAFSRDGTRVITISDKSARVWDASTGEPVTAPLETHQAIRAAALSPDGMRVVTACIDSVWIWDTSAIVPVSRQGTFHDILNETDSPNDEALLPVNNGSLEDWRRLVECGPFKLDDDVLIVNAAPSRRCSPSTR